VYIKGKKPTAKKREKEKMRARTPFPISGSLVAAERLLRIVRMMKESNIPEEAVSQRRRRSMRSTKIPANIEHKKMKIWRQPLIVYFYISTPSISKVGVGLTEPVL
jgi:hypothetical protein